MLKQTGALDDSADLDLTNKKSKATDTGSAWEIEMVGANGYAMPIFKSKK